MRILLTGGSGMVGQNLLEHPAIKEFTVIAPSSRELNLLDFSATQSYLHQLKPDLVIHAAGKVGGIQANIREPVCFLMDNLDMGRSIVWAAHQAGVKKLINLGSSSMYPRNYNEPLDEEMVLKGELDPPNEGYALAKVVTAKLCEYIMREDSSYQYKTLIPCNLYGKYDQFAPVRSHLIPSIIHKVYQAKQTGKVSVEMWGDGTARRELMYAGDLADALVHAIKEFHTVPALMNVGLGYDYTINQYYEVVAEVLGYAGSFTHDLSKPVGMARKLVSTERQEEWGWRAKTSLCEGVQLTFQFYSQNQK
jgi:GDP-L-fucose synthase